MMMSFAGEGWGEGNGKIYVKTVRNTLGRVFPVALSATSGGALSWRTIVDFVCLEKRLIIELDGGQHMDNQIYHMKRTDWLTNKHHAGEIHPGCFIIPCGNPSKALNFLKKSLNNVPLFVDMTVMNRQ